jgi:hypothetical protein
MSTNRPTETGVHSVGLYYTLVSCIWKPNLLNINQGIIPCLEKPGTKITKTGRLLDTFCFQKHLLHSTMKRFQINLYWACIGSS